LLGQSHEERSENFNGITGHPDVQLLTLWKRSYWMDAGRASSCQNFSSERCCCAWHGTLDLRSSAVRPVHLAKKAGTAMLVMLNKEVV
jgi:hypothetical protein